MIILLCDDVKIILEKRSDDEKIICLQWDHYFIKFDIEHHELFNHKKMTNFTSTPQRIQFILDEKSYVIYWCFDEQKYDEYRCYVELDEFAVSNLANSEITYNYGFTCKLGLINANDHIYVNKFHQNLWLNHQVLQIGFLKMIKGNGYMMINQVGKVHIDEFFPTFSHHYQQVNYSYAPFYIQEIHPLCVELKAPLKLSVPQHTSLLHIIGPTMTMSLASLTVGLIQLKENYTADKSLLSQSTMIIFPMVMLLSLLFWQPLFKWLNHKFHQKNVRIRNEKYLQYLDVVEKELQQYLEAVEKIGKHKALLSFHPFQGFSVSSEHWDYLKVVIGYGKIQGLVSFKKPPLLEEDDLLHHEINAFINDYDVLDDGYQILHLLDYSKIWIEKNEWINYSLVAQIFYHHHYQSLKVLIYDPLAEFEYLSHLPHVYDKEMLYFQQSSLLIKKFIEFDTSHMILICFNQEIECSLTFLTKIIIQKEDVLAYDLKISYLNHLGKLSFKYDDTVFTPLKSFDFKSFIQSLYHVSPSLMKTNQNTSFLNMKQGVYPLNQHHLSASIGFDEQHQEIKIDLHEDYDGPHGLIVGTTGSGKSELLITLLLSLMMNYRSDEVQFVLIDFKGTNLFHHFKHFPHMINHLSNLDEQMMERALCGLNQECIHRQKKIDELSSLSNKLIQNIDQYNQIAIKMKVKPLPHLVIVSDEFAQLKLSNPMMIDELISISRIGRSLGFHLILSTQRTQGIVDQQLLSNIHFKLCLKVNEAHESIDVLNRPDAFYIHDVGGFILSSQHQFTQGISAYTKAIYEDYDQDHQVILYDLMQHQPIKLQQPTNSSLTQIEYLANQSDKKISLPGLWKQPLKFMDIQNLYLKYSGMIDENSIFIGEIDDYQTNSQTLALLDRSKQVYLCFYKAQESYFKIINLLAYHCHQHALKLVILSMYPEYYASIQNVVNIIDLNDKMMITYLMNLSLLDTLIFIDEDQCLENMSQLLSGIKQKILFKQGTWIFNTTKSHCPYYLKFIIEKINIEQSKDQIFSSLSQNISFDLKDNQAFYQHLVVLSEAKKPSKGLQKFKLPKHPWLSIQRNKIILGYDIKTLEVIKWQFDATITIYAHKTILIDHFIAYAKDKLKIEVSVSLDINACNLFILSMSEQDQYRLGMKIPLGKNEMLWLNNHQIRRIRYVQDHDMPTYFTFE